MATWESSGARRGSQCPAAGTVSSDNSSWSLRDYAVALLVSLRLLPSTKRTRRYRQTGTVDSVTQANVEHQLSVKDNAFFHAAQCDDLDLLEESLKAGNCKLIFPSLKAFFEQRTAIGATAFHVALLFDSAKVSKRLLELFPAFVNMTFSGKLNYGEHPLHIAVVNQNFEMVKLLIEHGAKINEPRCTGSFFRPYSGHCQVYWGEHILSFAICTGQKDIVKYLLDNGALVNVCDSQQNCVLHNLVLQEDRKAALDMYKYLSEELDCVDDLMTHCNKQGLTPVKLAAHVGNLEVFEYMMKQRRQVHWTYGPITSCIYSLHDLDTFGDETSAVKLIVQSSARNAHQLLDVTPIRQLLEAKWHQFGLLYFFIWMVAYVSYMILFTMTVLYRPVKCSNDTFTSLQDILNRSGVTIDIPTCGMCRGFTQKSVLKGEAYSNWGDFLRLTGEIIVLLGVAVSITIETFDLCRRGVRQYFTNVGSGLFHIISWIFAALVITALIMRVTDSQNEEVCLAIALVIGWMYTLFFARGFASLGPYIAMIQKILRLDVGRFIIIFAVAIVGFSGAIFTLVRESTPERPDSFRSLPTMAVTLFKLAIGVTDISVMDYRKSAVSTWVVLFFVVYITFSYLLLVELLIALMGATHQKLERERTWVWKKQLASLILLLEPRIPKRLQIRSGFPASLFGLSDDDNWYIRVEEHGEMKKISHPIQESLVRRRRAMRRRKALLSESSVAPGGMLPMSGSDIAQQYQDTDKLIFAEQSPACHQTSVVIANHCNQFTPLHEEVHEEVNILPQENDASISRNTATATRRGTLTRINRVSSVESDRFLGEGKGTSIHTDATVLVHKNAVQNDIEPVFTQFSMDKDTSREEIDAVSTDDNVDCHPFLLTEEVNSATTQIPTTTHSMPMESSSPLSAPSRETVKGYKEDTMAAGSVVHPDSSPTNATEETTPSLQDVVVNAGKEAKDSDCILVDEQSPISQADHENTKVICHSSNSLVTAESPPSSSGDIIMKEQFQENLPDRTSVVHQQSTASLNFSLQSNSAQPLTDCESIFSVGSLTSYNLVTDSQEIDKSVRKPADTSHLSVAKSWWETESDDISLEESGTV